MSKRLEEVAAAIKAAWSLETSANPDWSANNPALGQCAVTACVLEDYLGGYILNTIVTRPDGTADSHYYNVIDDGREIDLTRGQFPEDAVFPPGKPKTNGFESTREYILSFEPTQERYVLLKQRVSDQMGRAGIAASPQHVSSVRIV